MHSRIRYPKEPEEATLTEGAQQKARDFDKDSPQAAA